MFIRKLSLFVAVLVAAGAGLVTGEKTFSLSSRSNSNSNSRAFAVGPQRRATDVVLDIGRGGAGPFDPNIVEKTNAVIQLSQAVPLTLSPSTALKLYGTKETPMSLYLIERCFTALLSYGIGIYCIVFQNTSTDVAFAFAALPWLKSSAKALLDGTPKKLGLPITGDFVGLITSSLPIYAVLSGADWTDKLVKGLCIWNIANGVLLGLFPQQTCKAWGTEQSDTTNIFLTRGIGWFLMGCGVYYYTLITGKGDSMQAMGYSMLTHFACVSSILFITKDVEKLGIDKNPYYFWMLEHLCVILTLAFPAADAVTEAAE